jgi:hypothetical protein
MTKTFYSKPQTCIEAMWAENLLCQSEQLGNTVGVVNMQENDLTGYDWDL